MLALGTAAEDAGVPRLQAERTGVGGDVRAALVDDADHPERHDDALDPQPVGAAPLGRDAADGIGKRHHRIDPRGDRIDAPLIETQPLEARPGHMSRARRGHVTLVRREDRARPRAYGGRRRRERRIFLGARSERQRLRRRERAAAESLHQLANVCRVHRSGRRLRRGGARDRGALLPQQYQIVAVDHFIAAAEAEDLADLG